MKQSHNMEMFFSYGVTLQSFMGMGTSEQGVALNFLTY